jgi:hypothetical protein
VEQVLQQDDAVCIAFESSKALSRLSKQEHGFAILQHVKSGRYYTTPPIASTSALTVSWRDYAASLDKAFARSCENRSDFVYAADVHTHPRVIPFPATDLFSAKDFNHAIQLISGKPAEYRDENGDLLRSLLGLNIAYEKGMLINTREAEVYWFEPNRGDKVIEHPDVVGLNPASSDLWTKYRDRSRPIGVACVK